MIVAKVVGTVVATRKDERLVSSKLLIVRPTDPHGKAEGNYLVAVDTVDAGFGETVLIVSGSSARMAARSPGVRSWRPYWCRSIGVAVGCSSAFCRVTAASAVFPAPSCA